MEQEARDELVTVLVPAYKESEYIETTLSGIAETFRAARTKCEILVVVDDVLGDDTGAKVANAARTYEEIRIIERKNRRGVGDAIFTGIRHSTGKTLVIAMGDRSEDPRDIVSLVDKAKHYDIVFTNRFKNGRPPDYPLAKYFANRVCNLSAKLVFHIAYSDITNAFKAYRMSTLSGINIASKGFEVFLELPVKAVKRTRSITEVEVQHTVMKNKIPKFSVLKDGYNYASLLLSLLAYTYCARDHLGQNS